MSSSTNHDPSSGHSQGAGTAVSMQAGLANHLGLDSSQVANFLRQIPTILKGASQGEGDAAQILSSLNQQQSGYGNHHMTPHQMAQHPYQGSSQMNDPGPSSHPRGPPNLGQLSTRTPPLPNSSRTPASEGSISDAIDHKPADGHGSPDDSNQGSGGGGRARSGRSANMSNDEWARQRKDNHKEVERRRRGNINEGINELGRIVPNGSGEKAKGAILSRAVQYIHHLKENEARNIEKWTLEKLLMDQAMGDLQTQLEDMRRMWEEERDARQRVEEELEVIRGGSSVGNRGERRERSPGRDGNEISADGDESRGGKRQRVSD